MREFSLEELAKADGKDGRPSYIAYQGKVFEVSDSKRWKNGSHMRRHAAGADLTADLQAAPHGEEVFERFPQVGTLLPPADEVEIPALLKRLIEKVPFLERHPHPMTVHFPIVFMFSTTVFNLLYLLTGVKAFETTAFHCLGAGLLFTLVAIFTGWYAWWLVYLAKPMRPVNIKKAISYPQEIAAASRINAAEVVVSETDIGISVTRLQHHKGNHICVWEDCWT